MPLFDLPITFSSSAPQSRVQFSSIPLRNKRKRAESPIPSLSDDDDNDARSQHSRSEAAASTNPLSLTPAEVLQYHLAGLELDEEIPNVKGWPHRGFPAEHSHRSMSKTKIDIKGKGKERVGENGYIMEGQSGAEHGESSAAKIQEEERGKAERRPKLRLQHLSVLVAILQRCLLEGDLPRAGRAWAMLIRTQVGGKGIDLRSSGYWAIGAELLLRSGETPPKRPQRRNSDTSNEDEEIKENQDSEPRPKPKGEKRWGSAAGLEKTKEYYERLILQHPYKRQFHGNVSALDFWPAMIGCEIYGIQYEQKENLRKAAENEENEDNDAAGSRTESDQDHTEEDENDIYTTEAHKMTSRRRRRAEKGWQERDEIRKTALAGYEKLAARLDELMTTPPYSDSYALLRLRGMIALCIGDLSVSAMPTDEEMGSEDEETLERNRRLGIGGKDTERRLHLRQRVAQHERGRKKQYEEHLRARKLFERIERKTGKKEGVTDSLPVDENDAEEFYNAE